MTDLNQNFSIFVGDDNEVLFDVGPDDDDFVNLEFADLTLTAYPQANGVPDMTTTLITKTKDDGIEITDPLLMKFTVAIGDADIDGLSGNYFYQIKLVFEGSTTTLTTGLMTVIDPEIEPNVVAFKAMFPDFVETADTQVQIALDAAALFVDDSWDASQLPATMYLAAHYLSLAESETSSSGGTALGKITSVTVPGISVRYSKESSDSSSKTTSSLDDTPYGVVFANMLTAQGCGIAIV